MWSSVIFLVIFGNIFPIKINFHLVEIFFFIKVIFMAFEIRKVSCSVSLCKIIVRLVESSRDQFKCSVCFFKKISIAIISFNLFIFKRFFRGRYFRHSPPNWQWSAIKYCIYSLFIIITHWKIRSCRITWLRFEYRLNVFT